MVRWLRVVTALMLVASVTASCATGREIPATKLPEMMIEAVERNVPKAEIEDALRRIIANEPVCLRIPPAHWLAVKGRPRSVRFDLPDWDGREIAPDAEQRLDAFVDMGFLTKSPVPGHDARYAEYDWTSEGLRVYDGREAFPAGTFCPPAERRFVAIERVRWDHSEKPAVLRVDFSHTADDYPSWMRTEAVRARYASRLPPLGIAYSSVSLYRIWRKSEDPAENAPRSGKLEQWCYDYVHNRPMHCSIDLNRALDP